MRKELKGVLFGALVVYILVAVAFLPLASPTDHRSPSVSRPSGQTRSSIDITCTNSGCKRENPNALELSSSLDFGPAPMDISGRASNVNKWAVLAGVSDYPGTSMDLQQCHWDVFHTRDKLLQLGWPDSHIHLLLNETATYANILSEIAWMKGQTNSTSQTYFHYSGHGNSGIFYVYDTTMTDDTLANAFNGYTSRQNVIVMDTCYAGSFTALKNLPGTVGMMACSDNEYSYDGMFTPNLMAAMKNSTVSVQTAFAAAKQSTAQMSNGYQNPIMWDTIGTDLFLGYKAPDIIGTFPVWTAPEDTPITVQLTPYEHDEVDTGVDLKWSVSIYDTNAIATFSGERSDNDTLVFTPKDNYYGTTNIELTLSNSVLLKAKKMAPLTWTSVNDKPSVNSMDRSGSSILRTKPVTFKLFGADVDNLPSELNSEFQVSPAGTDQWQPLTGAKYVLGHWEVTWTTTKDTQTGAYDLRGRLTDEDGASSDWMVRTNVVTIRNNQPVITSMNVPASSVERTRSISIGVTGSDVEDAAADLFLELEFKAPGGDFKLTGTATYETDHWNITFAPTVDAMLGLYDIRARLKDKDGVYSDYLYKNNTFEVTNCRPAVTDMIPDTFTVLRGKTLSLIISGYDAEDQNKDLVLDAQYLGPSGVWVDMDAPNFANDQWSASFSPELDAALGNYSFRAKLSDSANAEGDWAIMNGTVEVLNNRPVVTAVQMDQSTVLRTQTLAVLIKGSDQEDLSSDLTGQAQLSLHGKTTWGSEGIGALQWTQAKEGWTFSITPSAHFVPGSYDLRVRLSDRDGGAGDWYTPASQIEIKNGPPILDLKQPAVINEAQATIFDASGSTDPEGGPLTFVWDFGDTTTSDAAKPTHTYKSFGTYTLKLTAKDLEGLESAKEVSLTVNGLPTGTVASQQDAGFQNFNVKFNSKDTKDPEGTKLTYQWDFDTSDGSGVDSMDPSPSHNYGKPGTYEWKVTITDGNGGTTIKTGKVTVNAMSQFTIGLLVLLVILIAVVVVAAAVLLRRKKKQPPAVTTKISAPVPGGRSLSLLDADDI
jgi:hypothetical protein